MTEKQILVKVIGLPIRQKSSMSKRKKCNSQHILRPRTAYNFFYRHQRDIILNEKLRDTRNGNNDAGDKIGQDLLNTKSDCKSHGLIGLQQLTKTVAKRWKEASVEKRRQFKLLAEQDKIRYTKAMMSRLNPEQEFPSQDSSMGSPQEASFTKNGQVPEGCATHGDDNAYMHKLGANNEIQNGYNTSLPEEDKIRYPSTMMSSFNPEQTFSYCNPSMHDYFEDNISSPKEAVITKPAQLSAGYATPGNENDQLHSFGDNLLYAFEDQKKIGEQKL